MAASLSMPFLLTIVDSLRQSLNNFWQKQKAPSAASAKGASF